MKSIPTISIRSGTIDIFDLLWIKQTETFLGKLDDDSLNEQIRDDLVIANPVSHNARVFEFQKIPKISTGEPYILYKYSSTENSHIDSSPSYSLKLFVPMHFDAGLKEEKKLFKIPKFNKEDREWIKEYKSLLKQHLEGGIEEREEERRRQKIEKIQDEYWRTDWIVDETRDIKWPSIEDTRKFSRTWKKDGC